MPHSGVTDITLQMISALQTSGLDLFWGLQLFFHSRFIVKRGLKTQHTLSISYIGSLHEHRTRQALLIWIHSRTIHEWAQEKEGRGREETPRQQRTMEGKFGGDLRLGPSPGFLSPHKQEVQGPSVTHLVGIPLFTQSGSAEEGF